MNTNRYEDIDGGVTLLILKCGAVYKIDTADRPLVARFTWHRNDKKFGYAKTNVRDGRKYRHVSLHRMLCQTTDERPFVDHANNDFTDNRRLNLRACTRGENNMNKRRYKNGTTGVKGVFLRPRSGSFEAYVGLNGKQHYLGAYRTTEMADVAIREFRERLHGEFARHV